MMLPENFSQTLFEHHPDIVSRVIAGEVILIPIRNNTADMDFIYTLNETAARIWELTDGTRTPEEIAREITDEFDTDLSQAQVDLQEVFSNLFNIGAIREVRANL